MSPNQWEAFVYDYMNDREKPFYRKKTFLQKKNYSTAVNSCSEKNELNNNNIFIWTFASKGRS